MKENSDQKIINERLNNIYFDVFVKTMKDHDVIHEDVSFDPDHSDHNNIYFDTFIKTAIDHGAIPTVDSLDSKELEACNSYFESFVKTSLENGLFQKIDRSQMTHQKRDFDAYFETFVSNSLQNSGQAKTDFTKSEILDTTTVYFDLFAKNYAPTRNSDTSKPSNLDTTAGQNIYFDTFLNKSASVSQ